MCLLTEGIESTGLDLAIKETLKYVISTRFHCIK